jgi:hypothetical protein
MSAPLTSPPPVQWATLTLATCNTLNLALPARRFYDNQAPYSAEEYARKTSWLGTQIQRLNADVIAFQEVWDLAALKDAVQLSRLRYPQVLAPGAELGATGTPRVALATRLTVDSVTSIADFPPQHAVEVPELGTHARFERPVLHAVLRTRQGQRLHVLVCHLKSKRAKYLQDAQGVVIEDRDDPRITARASRRRGRRPAPPGGGPDPAHP